MVLLILLDITSCVSSAQSQLVQGEVVLYFVIRNFYLIHFVKWQNRIIAFYEFGVVLDVFLITKQAGIPLSLIVHCYNISSNLLIHNFGNAELTQSNLCIHWSDLCLGRINIIIKKNLVITKNMWILYLFCLAHYWKLLPLSFLPCFLNDQYFYFSIKLK